MGYDDDGAATIFQNRSSLTLSRLTAKNARRHVQLIYFLYLYMYIHPFQTDAPLSTQTMIHYKYYYDDPCIKPNYEIKHVGLLNKTVSHTNYYVLTVVATKCCFENTLYTPLTEATTFERLTNQRF